MKALLASLIVISSSAFANSPVDDSRVAIEAVQKQESYKAFVADALKDIDWGSCRPESPTATELTHNVGARGSNKEILVIQRVICNTSSYNSTRAIGFIVTLWGGEAKQSYSEVQEVRDIGIQN